MDYANSIEWLMDVAEGKIKLGAGIEIELDPAAQDKALKSLILDDLHMTQGNTAE